MKTMMPRTLTGVLISAALASANGVAHAAEVPATWRQCGPVATGVVSMPDAAARRAAPLLLDAGRAEYLADERLELSGAVRLQRADQSLAAGHALYDAAAGRLVADGGVEYTEAGQWLAGERIELELNSDAGWIEAGRYALPGQHLRGSARRAEWDGADRTVMTDATYTSCDPGDPGWVLEAGRIDIDRVAGRGTARDVVLRVGDLPLFYSPVLWFPIDDRRVSGFLPPSLEQSDARGLEVATPYYWNLAPQHDATLTPRLSARRGLQLDLEYRYLYRLGDRPAPQRGQFDIEYLPDDRAYGDDRMALRLQHTGSPAPRWETNLDLAWVSDDDFLRDLGSELETIGTSHLRREARVAYDTDDWSLDALASFRQPLDGSRPYQTLPNVAFDYHPAAAGPLRFGLRGDWTRYDRAARSDGLRDVTGDRIDLAPWAAYRTEADWGYVESRLTLRHTGYRLDDLLAGSDATPQRTLPLLSVDAGLYLDRLEDGTRRQSLEPRVRYLYVPYRDQEALIRNIDDDAVTFDASLPALDFARLFHDNRFSGLDRVGDANQLSMALTSRWYDAQGEWARARVGQILYFRDRTVVLPGGTAGTDASSSLLADTTLRLGGGYEAGARLHWNPHTRDTELLTLDLAYHGPDRREASLGYRRDAGIEQADLRIAWPLGDRWRGYGRWRHSLRDGQRLEALAGFTYDSCCWSARLLARDYQVDAATGAHDLALLFQIELKGLSRFGHEMRQYVGDAL